MELKKLNRVSWASGPNLCQVKNFLPEDCPSKVGRGSQHHLLVEPSHLNITRPSFETRHCLKQSKKRISYMPQVKWKCPSKFILNDKWCVVAGQESKEVEAQMHREKRVLEAVYPSRSSIPPNPSSLLNVAPFYDDSQTRLIPIIPIEEVESMEVSSHLKECNELLDPCPPKSSSSSISTETSQTLPASGKAFPQSFSTSQNLTIPQSDSPFPVRQPSIEQTAPPYPSKFQNLNGSEQSQVSLKPPVNHNPVSQYSSTYENPSIPKRQIEFLPKLSANQNGAPKHPSTCENLNIPQLKSQVSGTSPANHNPAPRCPSTCENVYIPQHQTEVFPKPLANHNRATQCQPTNEKLNLPQCNTTISPKPPANGVSIPQYQSTSENPSVQHKTQVCSNPPANEKSILEIPHGFKGDLVAAAATAVAALAKSQEPGSMIDTDLLIKLLSNPEHIQTLMNEHRMGTNPKTGAASDKKPIVCSSATPSATTDSPDKQIAGNENRKCAVTDSTVFSRSVEVRNTNEQRETRAISRPVDPLVPLAWTKPDKVINKSINEHQAHHTGCRPIFGPTPMAKSVKGNLVNEQWPPTNVGIADNRGVKPLVPLNADLNLEKVKKLINEYGAPDSVGGKTLVNSELVPSTLSKRDAVVSSSRVNLPITSQPELRVKSYSPNVVVHASSPFSSMTCPPAPVLKDTNYYKSLIKQHGENREYVDQQLLQNTNHYGNNQGPEMLKNLRPEQPSLNFRKHCVFFNTTRGCLNGSSCPFLHDLTKQWRSGGMLEAPGPKRMKLGGELTGRT